MKILKYLKLSLLVPFTFLLFVHFVIKDRTYDLAMLFNISPVPVLIGIGLLLSLILIHHKKWFRAIFFVTLLLTTHWFFSYYGFKDTPINKDNNHILLWNIDNSKSLPRDAIHEKIKTHNPDIMVFLEAKNIEMNELKDLKKQFPGYNFKILQGYFLLASKGDIEHIEYTKLEIITKFHLLNISIDGKTKRILLTDVGVVKHYNRWQDLEVVLDYALKNKADILLGDFNTPYESMHFDGFRDNYKSFHDVSEGFAATWPKGLPLLELDQIWTRHEVQLISLKKFFFKEYSNHDMLIGSFKFKD